MEDEIDSIYVLLRCFQQRMGYTKGGVEVASDEAAELQCFEIGVIKLARPASTDTPMYSLD